MKACPLCLSIEHLGNPCPWKEKWGTCKIDNCGKYHSHLLHDAESQGLITSCAVNQQLTSNATTVNAMNTEALLQVQVIPTTCDDVITFFDLGSIISLVSTSFVKRNGLKGVPVSFDLVTVGGDSKRQSTYLHEVCLKDQEGGIHNIQAFQIDDVCGRLQGIDISPVVHLFAGLSKEDVQRPDGPIELLVGMPYASIHPTRIDSVNSLVLYKSIFGSGDILGGCHPSLVVKDQLNAFAEIVAHGQIQNTSVMCNVCRCKDPGIDFFSTEDLGVKLPARCARCKNCKTCTTDVYQLSMKELRELTVIEENLVLDPLECRWETPYPYKMHPSILENNERQADDLLCRQEKRFKESEDDKKMYNEQFDDCIKRGVFREIDEEEQRKYEGPVFYVTHNPVYKEGSSSTPMRLVINSSLKYKGRSLNDVLVKGPNVLNDILGVQLRFRSYRVAVVCDLRKMYHSIKTTLMERHLRRMKFRYFDSTKKMKTYGIETVTFGDRPAAAIASTAVRKTA